MDKGPENDVDFEALFCVWALSGLHVEDFWDGTALRGPFGNDELFQIGMFDWKPKLKGLSRKYPDNAMYKVTLSAERKGSVEPGDIRVPRKEAAPLPQIITAEAIGDPVAFGDRNRPRQVIIDWTDAQMVRDYLHDKMRFAYLDQRDEITGKMIRVPILSMGDLRHLAATIKDLQTVQRLSLGLSSDNVGVSSSPQMPTVNVTFRKAIAAGKRDE